MACWYYFLCQTTIVLKESLSSFSSGLSPDFSSNIFLTNSSDKPLFFARCLFFPGLNLVFLSLIFFFFKDLFRVNYFSLRVSVISVYWFC